SGCDLPSNSESASTRTDPPSRRPKATEMGDLSSPDLRREPLVSSAEIAASMARFEKSLRSQGLLRQDLDPPDAPFDAATIATNFIRIALYEEYTPVGGRLVAREKEALLRRWARPVRLQVIFGDSVPEPRREADLAIVDELAQRLSIASGHPVRRVTRSGNFVVFVVNEDERLTLDRQLNAAIPGLPSSVRNTILDLSPSILCVAVGFSNSSDNASYSRAVAIIRAEHPPLLRKACFHEEITQGLGLPNDSDQVRPSIFNDDEEFALLTRHDEYLLKILFDPRLKPGMGLSEASPIVAEIAQELLPMDVLATDEAALVLDPDPEVVAPLSE
ncbi:MAG: DUF2927 domain-containing protein, partial [Mangrovicoccus sp.]